ncbi:hypothetical protein JCM11491_004473 [Sporobolomyces phaffii]
MPTRSYRLETSDLTSGTEVVTIRDPPSARLIWSKTRSLTEDEIVSTVADSHQFPRFSLHRPRRGVVASTLKTSPPWPQYLVVRSPSFPDGQYIPLIDPQLSEGENKSKASTEEKEVEASDDTLEFKLAIPVRRPRSSRPAHLDLASRSSLSLDDDSPGQDETNPLTPTKANPFPSSTSTKKKPRPKSANYRVDMTPSLSQDSTTSSTSASSSVATDRSFTSQDPLSSPTAPDPPLPRPLRDSSRSATFKLQPFIPGAMESGCATKSVARRVLDRVRSFVVEDAKSWSCVWTKDSCANDDTSTSDRVVMHFREDPPTLFPSPLRGTLSLLTDVVDESGYEPSFWVAIATAWMECQEERAGWREGRGGD